MLLTVLTGHDQALRMGRFRDLLGRRQLAGDALLFGHWQSAHLENIRPQMASLRELGGVNENYARN